MKIGSFLAIGLLAAALSGCITDGKLTSIDPNYVFNDNSSKVWLVNHCYKNGKDFAPLSNKYKQIITFYQSGNCYVQQMNTFGDEAGRKGAFTVQAKKKHLSIDFTNESWNFKLKMLSHRKIILVPEGKFAYTLELIPVPEP